MDKRPAGLVLCAKLAAYRTKWSQLVKCLVEPIEREKRIYRGRGGESERDTLKCLV